MTTRVLIVDSYPDAAEMLCALLRGHGFSCDFVSAVEEAHQLIEANPPDVAFLDVGRPWVTMTEAANDLRRRVAGRMVLISYTSRQDRGRRPPPGYDHGVPKPASIHELLDALDVARTELDAVS